MPKLPNPRHERFAFGVASGLSATKAYEEAGYPVTNSSAKAASRLSKNVEVAARIEELTSKATQTAAEKLGIDKEYVLAGLQKVYERCMTLEEVHRDGKPTGEFVFNAAGANKALENMGKHLEMFVEKKEVDNTHTFHISDQPEDPEQWIAENVPPENDRRRLQ